MKKIITLFCVLVYANALKAQTTIPEALNITLDKNTLKSNTYIEFMDKSKQIMLPADGLFLYSSLNNNADATYGYDNNENYVVTITDPNKRTIWLRTQYFALADEGDVLKIYDGADTLQTKLLFISDQMLVI